MLFERFALEDCALGKKNVKAEAKPERVVKYPKRDAVFHEGTNALTADWWKEALGWEVIAGTKGDDSILLVDRFGSFIRCRNNLNNRPLDMVRVEQYVQELLTRNWCGPTGNMEETCNGEAVIIGQFGTVLNAQHQGIALVLAEQDRLRASSGQAPSHLKGDAAKKFVREVTTNWPEAVRMDKLVVYGIAETDKVINTMDTAKPRSLVDVIYRSEFFANSKKADRLQASRMLDSAVRILWHRTGAEIDAFAPRRTHAEAIDFVYRHPRLTQAIAVIQKENKKPEGEGTKPPISEWISAGYAAGLLYLFAASQCDADEYHKSDAGKEDMLDLDVEIPHYGWDGHQLTGPDDKPAEITAWERACEFWIGFACTDPASDSTKGFEFLREAIVKTQTSGLGGKPQEVWSLFCQAWSAFVKGDTIDKKSVNLKYKDNEKKQTILLPESRNFSVGGLDLGPPIKESKTKEVSEQEVEDEKRKIREENERKGRMTDEEAFEEDDGEEESPFEEDTEEGETLSEDASEEGESVAAAATGWKPPTGKKVARNK